MRYKKTTDLKRNGVVYTPESLATFTAYKLFEYKRNKYDLDKVSICDPACGEGDLIYPLVDLLIANRVKHLKVVGYETDTEVALKTQSVLKTRYPNVEIEIRNSDFLQDVDAGNVELFDYVIANPPYIRTQILGSEKSQAIAENLNLSGRVDMYYAFLVLTRKILKEDGIAGYITSNKFMTIKSGKNVREFMINNYSMKHIYDLGDTKLFNASVLPCILIFEIGKTLDREQVKFTSVYEYRGEDTNKFSFLEDIFSGIDREGVFTTNSKKNYEFIQGHLLSLNPENTWGGISEKDKKWLDRVEANTWKKFSDIGKIRVGIKTTADNVFIKEEWNGELSEIELLKPLITHRNSGQIISNNENHWKVLYTHTVKDGKKVAVKLDDYPKAKKYLEEHFDQLNGRKYIHKANRNWYEIWVPQNPDSWCHRKIVFRDISEKPQFWFDETGSVINGDCYWIDIDQSVLTEEIYLALAIANSNFIEKYYDLKFNNKLYSGKRRYQTQYVELFPIPYYGLPESIEITKIVQSVIANREYSNGDKKRINDLVNRIFS